MSLDIQKYATVIPISLERKDQEDVSEFHISTLNSNDNQKRLYKK